MLTTEPRLFFAIFIIGVIAIVTVGAIRLSTDARIAQAAIAAGLVQDKDGHWVQKETAGD